MCQSLWEPEVEASGCVQSSEQDYIIVGGLGWTAGVVRLQVNGKRIERFLPANDKEDLPWAARGGCPLTHRIAVLRRKRRRRFITDKRSRVCICQRRALSVMTTVAGMHSCAFSVRNIRRPHSFKHALDDEARRINQHALERMQAGFSQPWKKHASVPEAASTL